MPPRGSAAAREAAVIDIGSNSVRLVLYRLEGRAIWTTYNEKVLAGLGRDLPRTGKLSPEGVRESLAALRRFRAVLDGVRSNALYPVATAAAREAKDGPDFIRRIRDETGFDVRVLTGEEEARFSALGVAAGIPGADGVVGDLGGFSLELVRLKQGEVGKGVTLPLGPFALRSDKGAFDFDTVRAEAARRLAGVGHRFRCDSFYAVGGAWRNLALIHMRMADYPLQVVHQYELGARDAADTARFIARQSQHSLERIPGISKKRLESLPYSAAVLAALVEALHLKRISICAYGVREGLLFDAMDKDVQARDPLVEGCASLAGRPENAEALGAALQGWMSPLLDALPPVLAPGRETVLAAAAARLADFGSRLHPDHRAELVFQQALRAPIPGMDHPERAFLAVAAFARHASQSAMPEPATIQRILPPEGVERARVLGAAIRLGSDLSGRSPDLLRRGRLRLDNGALVLEAAPEAADLLLGEQAGKRAATLANLLDRKLEIRTG
ncbi:MAG TPA: Ppx/GppA phosphatase family protein [Caulobacteraceae bacterium]|jgi:exopolyphosphatase/guanosine-5'-triphosphate,3'-diphosphate pyrophosphatase